MIGAGFTIKQRQLFQKPHVLKPHRGVPVGMHRMRGIHRRGMLSCG
nr:hypothetical protein KXZ65_18980 [Pectobacterium sp. PL152]